MTDVNAPFHANEMASFKQSVRFVGTGPLIRGQGVCYDLAAVTTDTGETATDAWGERSRSVALPSTSNNNAFAGVTAHSYASNANGQWVEIYTPGSICEVAVGADTTINTGFLTCSVGVGDVGIFSRSGMYGRGSAIPLQTTTASVLVKEIAGGGSMATATLTDSSAFTGVAVDDIVYITSSVVTATGTGDATSILGKYLVGTVTDTSNLILKAATAANGHDNATSAAPAWTAASVVDYHLMSGQAYCMCKLLDGPESGCVQNLDVDDAATVDAMAFGTTYINGVGSTAGAAQDVDMVAQVGGGFKRFVANGIATSNAQTISEDSGVTGFTMDGTVMTTLVVLAALDHALLLFDPLGVTATVMASDMTMT